MTMFFDKARERINATSKLGYAGEALHEVEHHVVDACTFAAMQPQMPSDLRLAIHEVVLRYGVATLPACAEPADFETDDQHRARISRLVWDLHTVFHEVAHRGIPGFNDSPDSPYRSIIGAGDEERETLVMSRYEAAGGGWFVVSGSLGTLAISYVRCFPTRAAADEAGALRHVPREEYTRVLCMEEPERLAWAMETPK